MGMRCCACSLTPILAVAGLLGLGAAGYRVAGGGCPLCHHDPAAATKLVSASASAPSCPAKAAGCPGLSGQDATPPCCAGMTRAECRDMMSQCPAQGGCCAGHDNARPAAAPEKVAAAGN